MSKRGLHLTDTERLACLAGARKLAESALEAFCRSVVYLAEGDVGYLCMTQQTFASRSDQAIALYGMWERAHVEATRPRGRAA